jgi:hypothetical protein
VSAPLTFDITTAHRVHDDALGGYLPREFPLATYGRDRALPPDYASVLAHDAEGHPVVWQIGRAAFGFAGHPGVKRAMIEDLIMEFDESPEDVGAKLDLLRTVQRPLEDALVPIMAGLVQASGWMDAA